MGGWIYLVEKNHSALGPGMFPAAARWGGIVTQPFCRLLQLGVPAPAGPNSLWGGLRACTYVHEWPHEDKYLGRWMSMYRCMDAEFSVACTAMDTRA